MAYRKHTLRSMLPVTRKVARLIGEIDSTQRRLKNLIPELQRMEIESRALLESMKEGNGHEAEPPKDIEFKA